MVTAQIHEWEMDAVREFDADRDEEAIAVTHDAPLPKLAQCGVIDDDRRTKTIHDRPNDLLAAQLGLTERYDTPS